MERHRQQLSCSVSPRVHVDIRSAPLAQVWMAAVGQLFFGVSAGLGTLTTYASYTPRDAPVVRSAIIVCLSNSAFVSECMQAPLLKVASSCPVLHLPLERSTVDGLARWAWG